MLSKKRTPDADSVLSVLRPQAEAALRRDDEWYRLLVTTSLDGLLLTTPDGGILAANEAACCVLGWSEEELIRMGRSGIVDVSVSNLAPVLVERARTGRFQGELTLVRQDRTTFIAEVSSVVFTDASGHQRTSMVIRDVSERKRAEEALHQSREQMRTLATRLQDVLEAERTRLAREIHDVLAQDLTRLKIDLVWLHGRLLTSVDHASAKATIVVSDYDEPELRSAALASGADHFFVKTTECGQLQDLLHHLQQAGARG